MLDEIYISAHLPIDTNKGVLYGKKVYDKFLEIDDLEIIEIKNHYKNIWCRDYMPVKSSSGKYVQFKYSPSYMTDSQKWKERLPIANEIHNELKIECISSDIILDGGAIEIFNKTAIISDRVFRDNPDMKNDEILEEIKTKLELYKIIVIPQHPYDFTGHVDGLVRFVDENTVLINDMKYEKCILKNKQKTYRNKLIENWHYSFMSVFLNAGLKMEELPTFVPENGNDKSGEGIYINFLLLENCILMPAYRNDIDNDASKILEHLYERNVKMIYANELAKEGGMINCVTWTK